MAITISPTPDIEEYLREESKRMRMSVEAYALEILREYVVTKKQAATTVDKAKAIALFQSWRESEDEDDIAEQVETGNYLIRVLDENRLSDRKLFPPEMKGISW